VLLADVTRGRTSERNTCNYGLQTLVSNESRPRVGTMAKARCSGPLGVR
jgi:hypothetical protein